MTDADRSEREVGATRPAGRGFLGEVATLGRSSAIYLVPMFLTRGLTFVLTPVYTRYLTPAEYGVVGLASTVLPLFALLLGLSMHSAASRLHHSMPDDAARKRLAGTVLTMLLTVPVALACIVEVLGSLGLFTPFRSVPYSPHLRWMLWGGVFSLFGGLGTNLLVVREQHGRAALQNAIAALTTAAFTILLVIVLRRGAVGQLEAIAASNAVVALWSLGIALRIAGPVLDRRIATQVLAFSLPLVPHELSKWGLAASDRLVLERYVGTADLGQYSLAYTMASSIGIVLGAIGLAFFPIVNRKLADGDPSGEVPLLGNVVVLVGAWVSLGVALVLPPVLDLVTPDAYRRSAELIPVIAIGFFLQGLYSVWAQGTFFARRTGLVATITLIGVALNILLNLLLVPRFGVVAAMLDSIAGYAVMAAAHAVVARRITPVIPWEYGRAVRIAVAACGTYALARLADVQGTAFQLGLRAAAAFLVFPLVLLLVRAVAPTEVRRVRTLVQRRGRR